MSVSPCSTASRIAAPVKSPTSTKQTSGRSGSSRIAAFSVRPPVASTRVRSGCAASTLTACTTLARQDAVENGRTMPVVPRIEIPPRMPSRALVVLRAIRSPSGTLRRTQTPRADTSTTSPTAAAINPVPRQQIAAAVGEVVDVSARGVWVRLSVPDGERMARKTTNARLGILGGISILGTTGIVRPFSTASWRASVVQAVSVLAAQPERTLVLATGGRTEKAAMRLLPDLPEVCFVEVGDFTGAAIREAVEHGLTDMVFVGMVGKLAKLAAGVLMTHYTRSAVDRDLLVRITAEAGADPAVVEAVREANTARHAYEQWDAAGVLNPAGRLLCARVAEVLGRFADGRLHVKVAMVDFAGDRLVAATVPAWESA